MRVWVRALVSVVAGVAVSVAAPAAIAAPGDPVTVPDAALRGCLANALGVSPESPLTEGQLAAIGVLRCDGLGIRELTGIEYLTHVQWLSFVDNHVIDTTPLAQSPAQGLDLTTNDIVDVTPVGRMPNLAYVTLNTNHITDLRPIAGQARLFGTVCGECGGGPRVWDQTVALPETAVDQPVPFAVIDIFGNPATLSLPSGAGYADGQLTFDSPGEYSIGFSAKESPQADYSYFFGTATITVTAAAASTITPGDVTISGVGRVGQTLTADAGRWAPASVEVHYRWLRDGRPIRGETASAYHVSPKDIGHRLAVRVTGTAAGYDDVTVTSMSTTRVRAGTRR